jgi:hypothetical protein
VDTKRESVIEWQALTVLPQSDTATLPIESIWTSVFVRDSTAGHFGSEHAAENPSQHCQSPRLKTRASHSIGRFVRI